MTSTSFAVASKFGSRRIRHDHFEAARQKLPSHVREALTPPYEWLPPTYLANRTPSIRHASFSGIHHDNGLERATYEHVYIHSPMHESIQKMTCLIRSYHAENPAVIAEQAISFSLPHVALNLTVRNTIRRSCLRKRSSRRLARHRRDLYQMPIVSPRARIITGMSCATIGVLDTTESAHRT